MSNRELAAGSREGSLGTSLPLAGLTILLVEDNVVLSGAWRRCLVKRGAKVEIAATIAEAQRNLATRNFDGRIVDRRLPDGDGFEALLLSPEEHEVPTFRIAASGHFDERSHLQVQGVGAVVWDKSYCRGPEALIAAVQLACRRAGIWPNGMCSIGSHRLDMRKGTLHGPNGPAAIGSAEIRVLMHLVRKTGDWSTTAEIAAEVFKRNDSHARGLVWQYLARLRKVLGVEKKLIQWVRGKGYRIAGERALDSSMTAFAEGQ